MSQIGLRTAVLKSQLTHFLIFYKHRKGKTGFDWELKESDYHALKKTLT